METQVHADAGYTGSGEAGREITALKRTSTGRLRANEAKSKEGRRAGEERLKAIEKAKASVRAFVEHPFHITSRIYSGIGRVRYRGLAKNGHQLYTLFGLANLVIGARRAEA